jgi:hypothetical protein
VAVDEQELYVGSVDWSVYQSFGCFLILLIIILSSSSCFKPPYIGNGAS